MKKQISLILCLALLQTLLPANPALAAQEFTIRGTDAACAPGGSVSVDLVLENNPGFSAINLYYVFNTKYFTLTQVENRQSAFTMTHVTTTIWDAAGNFTEDAVLGTLHFQVAENTPAGEYPIEIVFLSGSNDAFQEITAQTVSATVTVRKSSGTGVKGDLDLDNDVDSDDLTLLARHVGGIQSATGQALANADVNGDKQVNSDDLTTHARYVGGIIKDWNQK